MRPKLSLILLLLAFPPAPLTAQEAWVAPGDRVRLHLSSVPGEPRQSRSLDGEVLAITADSLTLRLHPGASPVTIGLASVKRLERSLGVPTGAESALRQAAYVGTMAAVQFPFYDLDERQFASVGEAVLVGAAFGTAAGMILGALFPRERWQRVSLPGRPTPPAEALLFPRVSVGGGWGLAGGAAGSGGGAHAQAGFALARLTDELHLRGELLAQRAIVSGRFSCEPVAWRECLRREDETRRYGAAVSLVRESRLGDRAVLYLPLGLGLMHGRSQSRETRLPSTGCTVDGEGVPCTDDPTIVVLREAWEHTGVMANLGLGLSMRIAGVNAFVETRAQVIGERGRDPAQFAPLTLGLSF